MLGALVNDKLHVAVACALAVLATLACRGGAPATYDASAIVPSAEAAKLVPYLPPALGSFTATAPATTIADGPRISAERRYADGARTATARIATGDVRSEAATLDSNDEHAFGSDSPTYWRTTSVAGHRTRIAEERPVAKSSECYVRVAPNHIAEVRVTPASAGECERLAAFLDFAGIASTGGVPSPTTGRTR